MTRAALFTFLMAILFSCATDVEQKGNIEMDEDGFPIACELVEDTFLLNLFTNISEFNENPKKLENKYGQSCHYILRDNNGQKRGEVNVIINNMDSTSTILGAATRAKNSVYIDDMEFPAMWKNIGSLYTFIFNHGKFKVMINSSYRGMQNDEMLSNSKEIALHIRDNLKSYGFE